MSKYIKEKRLFNEEKRDFGYIVYSVIVLVYLLAINNTMTSALSVVAVVAVVPFIFRPEKFLPLLFACAINGDFFVAFQGISMARIYTIVFIVGMIARMIIKKEKIKVSDFIIHGLLILFVFLSCGTSYSGEMTPAFSFGLYIATLVLMLYLPFDRKYFLFGCALISLVLSVYYVVSLVSGSQDAIWGRVSVDDSVNVNSLGMSIAQLIGFNFAGYFVAQKKLAKLLLVAAGACNVISILLSGSRSALIGALGGIVSCIVLVTFGKSPEIRRISPLTIIIFTLGCFVAYFAVLRNDPEVLKRFTVESITERGGTGRTRIWGLILSDIFPSHPFLGIGYGGKNVSQYLFVNYGLSFSSHNFFFDILSSTGLIGVLTFIPYLISCLIKIVKTFKFEGMSLIPFTMLVTIVFNGIGENTLGTRIFWFAAGLCLMMSRQQREKFLPKDRKDPFLVKLRKNHEKKHYLTDDNSLLTSKSVIEPKDK